MRRCFVLLATLLAFSAALAHAQQVYAGKERMNGYSLAQFGDFIKDWKLVTVRFRHDTGELRFTYANDPAWKALASGSTDYPDGAVFAKVGIMTEDDPAFPSSSVPAGARRYQLMVKDSKQHKETDGWGYALFGPDGLATPEEPAAKTAACHACHAIVQDRGYVFSKRMPLMMPREASAASFTADQVLGSRLAFETVKSSALPARVRNLLPASVGEVRSLRGPLRKHLFAGTLDEIRPALIQEMRAAKLPVLLLAEDEGKYVMVYPDAALVDCMAHDTKGTVVRGYYSGGGDMQNDIAFEACDTALTPEHR